MVKHLSSFKERHRDQLPSSELDKRLLELSALFEISTSLNASLELKSILDNILLVPMGRMMISKGIILFHAHDSEFEVRQLKGLSQSLAGKMVPIESFPNAPLLISKNKSNAPWIQWLGETRIELVIPVTGSMHFRGLIGYGKKLSGQDYTEDEIRFLTSLGNIAAQSIENALMVSKLNLANRSLDQKVQELNTLFEIGRELNQFFERPAILKQLSYSLMGQLLVNQFFVALMLDGKLKLVYRKGSLFQTDQIDNCKKICEGLNKLSSPVLTMESPKYDHLAKLGISVIVPMIHQNTVNGYIFLGDKLDRSEFTSANLSFLSTLANMVIIALENSRLIRETIEKERLEEELNLAKSIQSRLLPESMPELEKYDIHGLNLPSKQVGGDYFDIIRISHKEYLFTIADVSGKGMPASLLMSNLQAGLHSLAGEQYSLDQTTSKLNKLIHRNTSIDKYITFFVLKLDLESGNFEYVNAGHNPPYLFSGGPKPLSLEDGGLILGMMPEAPYQLGRGKMKSGDLLVMFTDGVTEAMNAEEEEFGENGVISFLNRQPDDLNSEELNMSLLESLNTFSLDDPNLSDDITILTIRAKK